MPLPERYVKLVLALGQHDADYVDAYYGPPEWRKEAEARSGRWPRSIATRLRVEAALAAAKPAQPPRRSLRLRHDVPDASS